MVVQAGAGQRIAAVDPELTGETFQAIAAPRARPKSR